MNSTDLNSQSLGWVPIWVIRFVANYIPPLNALFQQLSQRYALRALDAYLHGKIETAVTAYCAAIQWAPDDARLRSALGQVYYAQGKLDDAEKQFRKALDSDYQDLRALKGLGSLLQERGEMAEARHMYLRYLEREPNEALILQNMGAILHAWGKYEEALQYYAQAEKEEPNDVLLRKNQALAFIAMGRIEEARKAILHAAKFNSKDGEIDRILGLVLENERNYDAAADCFKSAIDKDAEDADAHFEFAILSRAKDPVLAVQHAEIAARLFLKRSDLTGTAKAYWEIGWDYYLLGKLAESLEASTEALRFDPNFPAIYFNIGLVLLQMGRDAEARKRYNDGMQKVTQVADLKYYAIDDLSEALIKNPQLKGAAEILAVLEEQYAATSTVITTAIRQADGA